MELCECIINSSIFIDAGAEYVFDSKTDEDNKNCGHKFPTVEFMLMPTDILCEIADRIRIEKGYKPIYTVENYDDEWWGHVGWYDFFIEIGAGYENRIRPYISFVVIDSGSGDDEQEYKLILNEYEQIYTYWKLDEQSRKYYGKGCEELLEESGIDTEDIL